jgi:hypothetical protein
VHHRDPEQHQALPVDPVVSGVEAKLAGAVRSEDLEQVVGRDVERVQLRLVDRSAELVAESIEQLTVEAGM